MNLDEALVVMAAYHNVVYSDASRQRTVREALKVVWQEAEKVRLRIEEVHQSRVISE